MDRPTVLFLSERIESKNIRYESKSSHIIRLYHFEYSNMKIIPYVKHHSHEVPQN